MNKILSREQWQKERRKLLAEEKAHTRAGDRLAHARRELPWVRVEEDYHFTGSTGSLSLVDLFGIESQLIIYHLMFGVSWEEPCPGCSAWADAFNGTTDSFSNADAKLIAVSRAPIERLTETANKRGWTFTWVSSGGSDFNLHYGVSTNEEGQEKKDIGTEEIEFDRGENHGISVFVKEADGSIFHTYSCYNRGIEAMNGAFAYYDLLPYGRKW
jgi:predicted dithiol-disulfide oxidoreductase (DUF899 family)